MDAGVSAATAARVRRNASDWRTAIRIACEPLVALGAVTDAYPEACVGIVEEHGPYIVIAPGIALAHARPEQGVLREAVAVTTFVAPVTFDHPDNDPVDVVFAFGSPEAGAHIGMLQRLARALQGGLDARLREAADDAAADALLAEAVVA